MNPAGTDRYEIEEIVVKRKIPLDAVVIKVSEKEALTPMTKEIANSVPNVLETVKKTINMKKGRESILIMGVGNTCGIGNNHKEAMASEKKIRTNIRKMSKKKKKRKLLNRFN